MSVRFVDRFKGILFDMNATFMFGEDRLSAQEDFFQTYVSLGGTRMTRTGVQEAVLSICAGLGRDYDDPALLDSFPSVATAVSRHRGRVEGEDLLIERVIAVHEVGQVPEWAAATLKALALTHKLGVVSNVWSRGHHWTAELGRSGVTAACCCMVFSSDLGSIKPSPKPFWAALDSLALRPEEVLFVGDSELRDIRPAKALGMATAWISHNGDCDAADRRIGSIADLLTHDRQAR